VDIKADKPVTIFMAPADEWNAVLQHPQTINQLRQICVREPVVQTTYKRTRSFAELPHTK
jgi:hypothetical protein